MELIITSKEFTASLNMIAAIARVMPEGVDRRTFLDAHANIGQVLREFNDIPYEALIVNQDLISSYVNRLNDYSGEGGPVVSFQFMPSACRTQIEGSFAIDSDVMVEVTEAITEEIDGLAGACIALYGMVRMFTSSFKRLGKKVEAIVQNHVQLSRESDDQRLM